MKKNINIGDVCYFKEEMCKVTVNKLLPDNKYEIVWFDKQNNLHNKVVSKHDLTH